MKRYVLVGCGTRGIFSYCVPLAQQYGDCAMEIKRIFSEGVSFSLDTQDSVKVYDRNGHESIITIESEDTEGHGGADIALKNAIFRGVDTDPLGQKADLRNGMMSIGIGMAANISMAENRRVYLDEFYKGI